MARTHEIAIGIPRELHDQISKYLELDFVKKQGLTSKRQFVISCLRRGFEYFDDPEAQTRRVPQVNTNALLENLKRFNEENDRIGKLEKKIDEMNIKYKELENMVITTIKNPNTKIGFKNSQSTKKKKESKKS